MGHSFRASSAALIVKHQGTSSGGRQSVRGTVDGNGEPLEGTWPTTLSETLQDLVAFTGLSLEKRAGHREGNPLVIPEHLLYPGANGLNAHVEQRWTGAEAVPHARQRITGKLHVVHL